MESLWKADAKTIEETNLFQYLKWLESEKGLSFANYDELWQWSVDNYPDFWATQVEYNRIDFHSPFEEVHRFQGDFMESSWFSGAKLNYAEAIFKNKTTSHPAIIAGKEGSSDYSSWSWEELELLTAKTIRFLKNCQLEVGDRVVANVTNEVPAVVIYLACASLGLVFSSCSPDFGIRATIDRFKILAPKVLFTVHEYEYNGKTFEQAKKIEALRENVTSLETIVFLNQKTSSNNSAEKSWQDIVEQKDFSLPLETIPVDFSHPLVVLFSSGTTGLPKAITHSHGGILVEHCKYLKFHNDVKPGERFFWYSSTSWMMWNFLVSALLLRATIVLYEGAPLYARSEILWELAEKIGIHHFGCSAAYLHYFFKNKIAIKEKYSLPELRSIGSTGSPLSPEVFRWTYENVKSEMWLFSMSGGSDVCTAFVGGCPLEAIYSGEIQKRCLGAKIEIFNSSGKSVLNEEGELVITRPLPSMPIYFWKDENRQRYKKSYFSSYENVWHHGDRAKLTARQGIIIYGRSDATLNRHGVRMGSGEIYRSIDKLSEVKDSLVLNLDLGAEKYFFPLFVALKEGVQLTPSLKDELKKQIRENCSPRYVPEAIIEVPEIPYTLSGKKVEIPIKKILLGEAVEKVINVGSLRNPESIDFFANYEIPKK